MHAIAPRIAPPTTCRWWAPTATVVVALSPVVDSGGAGFASALERVVNGYDLSRREAQVALCCAEGMTNARIALELYLSPRTVHRHLNSVYRKIGTNSRAAAVRFATERGLIPGAPRPFRLVFPNR